MEPRGYKVWTILMPTDLERMMVRESKDFSNAVYVKQRDSDKKWAIFKTEDDTKLRMFPWVPSEDHARAFAGHLIGALNHNHMYPEDKITPDEYRSYYVLGHKRPKTLNRN